MRDLTWDGCFNARQLDLPHFLARSDALDHLTPSGWSRLVEDGVHTIIDLRNPDEHTNLPPLPTGVRRLFLPLDGQEDREFWDFWASSLKFGTPLYYAAHLRRFPHLTVRVLQALSPGTVFHCVLGRDRTGMIAMVAQWLLGVERHHIIEDYLQSLSRLQPLYVLRGEPDHGPLIQEFLSQRGTTLAAVCDAFLDELQEIDLDGSLLRQRFL